jgi:hypothetical protein
LGAIFLVSCSHQLKVVENNQTLVTIENFPKKDTTIMVKDYFIKYRKEGGYIIGNVESPFADGQGSFKTTNSVTIDIAGGKLSIY